MCSDSKAKHNWGPNRNFREGAEEGPKEKGKIVINILRTPLPPAPPAPLGETLRSDPNLTFPLQLHCNDRKIQLRSARQLEERQRRLWGSRKLWADKIPPITVQTCRRGAFEGQ